MARSTQAVFVRAACFAVQLRDPRESSQTEFNMFALARRIALAVGILWVAGWVGFTAYRDPDVNGTMRIDGPDAAPVPVEECESTDVREFVNAGEHLSITLCFRTTHDKTDKRLLAYGLDEKGDPLVAELDSREAYRHTKEVAADFVAKLDAEAFAQPLRSAARLSQWTRMMTAMLVGLLIGWGLVVALGRIIRAYLRIPKGADTAPHEDLA